MKRKRIVITGIGMLCSLGAKKEEIWNNVLKGKTNVIKENFCIASELIDSFFIHGIPESDAIQISDYDFKEESTATGRGKEVSLDLCYLLNAAKKTLEDSKIIFSNRKNNFSLVCVHENPGMGDFFSEILESFISLTGGKNISDCTKEAVRKVYSQFGQKAYNLQTFMVLYFISKALNIHGYCQFLNNSCSSGLYAIESAAQIIRSGRAPFVLVAGGDHPDFFKYSWFKQKGLYSDDGIIRPFCDNANGFVFGQGAAGLLVEDLDHALLRNAKIYGEYMGGGFNQEGWKVTFPAIGEDFYEDAVRGAIKEAKVNFQEIDLVVPHGVGSNIIDRFEAKVIHKVFKDETKIPSVTAFKPYFGHNLGGSALLETCLLLLSIENNLIPATLNFQGLNRRFSLDLKRVNEPANIRIALKMSCGFAGFNAAAIFRKFDE